MRTAALSAKACTKHVALLCMHGAPASHGNSVVCHRTIISQAPDILCSLSLTCDAKHCSQSTPTGAKAKQKAAGQGGDFLERSGEGSAPNGSGSKDGMGNSRAAVKSRLKSQQRRGRQSATARPSSARAATSRMASLGIAGGPTATLQPRMATLFLAMATAAMTPPPLAR